MKQHRRLATVRHQSARVSGRMILGIASAIATASITLPAFAQSAVLVARYSDSPINVRSRPSASSFSPGYGLSGDPIQVLSERRGDDGYTWYYIQFERSGFRGWVRSDLVRLSNSSANPLQNRDRRMARARLGDYPVRPVANQRRQTSPVPEQQIALPETIQDSARQDSWQAGQGWNREPVLPRSYETQPALDQTILQESESQAAVRPSHSFPQTYTPEQIEYFFEVAMGSEFGSGGSMIRKWQGDIRIKVHGSPTAEDRRTLQSVINEINGLTRTIHLTLDDRNPNLEIYFVPESDFRRYEPNYRPTNYGFFWTRWNGNTISNAKVLVSSAGINQQERSHLIREELTQSLGLMQDSYRYPDSIFFQGWTDTTAYSDLDRAAIEMLYRPEIRSGMTRSQVVAVLQSLNSGTIASTTYPPISEVESSLDARPALDFSLNRSRY